MEMKLEIVEDPSGKKHVIILYSNINYIMFIFCARLSFSCHTVM